MPKTQKEIEEEQRLLSRVSKLMEISGVIVCTINNVPLRRLHVSEQFNEGGLRQRQLKANAQCVSAIRQNGYDPGAGTLCAIEVGFTPEEWEQCIKTMGWKLTRSSP